MSTAQIIKITMPDGSIWGVPAKVVAEDRANFYRDEDGEDLLRAAVQHTRRLKDEATQQRKFKEERDYVLSAEGDFALLHWAESNMDWADVEAHAFKLQDRAAMTTDDFQEGWVYGAKEVARE